MGSRLALPIDDFLADIVRTVRTARAAVVVAAPGAGKTTRVPPALAEDGAVIVLQPRRVAARAIAQRIADERGWTLGDQVGWHVRFERRFADRTRVLLATEGILTARLLADPLLSGFRTIILDEFHERSIHADLGIALAKQAWLARDDLRIVVMSATIDARPVAAYLNGSPIVEVPGRQHAVEISYAPQQPLADAVREVVQATRGHVLCFLPGAPEIRRAMGPVQMAVGRDVEVLALHGSLDAAEQDRAIQASRSSQAAPPAQFSRTSPSGMGLGTGAGAGSGGSVGADGAGAARRRVILATNIAETSLTVPDVHAVIDTGLHKVARYDPARGIDSLDLERISADSADQRAGRAGRLGPGVARRLWDARDRLRPHREPDIARIDLAAPVLDLLAWGGDPDTFDWFDAPSPIALDAAWVLLERLGAVTARASEHSSTPRTPTPQTATPRTASSRTATPRTLTSLGRTLQRLPLHPRLGRILIAARGARNAARACALLAERHFLAPRHEATTCDLLATIDAWHDVPPHTQRVARELEDIASRTLGDVPGDRADRLGRVGRADQRDRVADEAALRRAIFEGYADRVGRRRAPGSPRVLLASGHGAVLAAESGVQDGEFLVALDVQAQSPLPTQAQAQSQSLAHSQSRAQIKGHTAGAGPHGARPPAHASEALIRMASLVDRDWLHPTHNTVAHWFDRDAGRVRAARREHYGELILSEHPIEPDPEIAARTLADAYLARPLREADQQLLRRLAFAGHRLDVATLVERAAGGPGANARARSDADAGSADGSSADRAMVSADSASVGSGNTGGDHGGRGSSGGAARGQPRTLDDIDLAASLLPDERRDLERLAPERLPVPSGRSAPLTYHDDGTVSAAVKLQELFGLADTPRLGRDQQPVLLHLLAPNGRPVQMTRDLRSFWARTYPEVRKELRGRYPKHPWPEDPWSAEPTARTVRRKPR